MGDEKKIVLLIEDEPALHEAVKMKLEKEGIEVRGADTGEKGLSLLAEKRPNLVWLDVLLPGINGLEVLRRIREDAKTKDLPVIIVSVSSGQEKVKQAFSMNVIDYIIKSEYTIDDIIEKVKNILEQLP